jgi:broad specificity phosphatase PhoE
MSESDVDNYEKKVANNQNQRRRLTVIIVRHGERLDYVHRAAGKNWCQANPKQPWNPPLTEKGLSMATQLGAALRQNIMPELGLPPIRAVYTSPFLRCRQTAAGIIQGMSSECIDHQSSDSNRDPIASPPLKVKVELGLAESMNENWYRSWSLPGTDGTWGYKRQEIPHIDPARDRMDPRALQPVENLLDWKESVADTHGILNGMMDHQYRSQTSLGGDYSFAGNPPKLESAHFQRNRIARTINVLSNEHHKQAATANGSIDKENEGTIVMVTHGGIVSQFYVNLTGNDLKKHGIGKYCSFSIYQFDEEASGKNIEKNDIGNEKWNSLVVNRVLWDGEKPPTQPDCENNTSIEQEASQASYHC